MSARGRLGIIKVSEGGTNLWRDWNPTLPDSLYTKTLDAVRTAKATRMIKVAGVLWMQGESDAEADFMAKDYGANLTAFIQSLRRDLGDQSIPFAACRINPVDPKMPYVADVRAGQESISLPGYAWFNCDGLVKQADGVHYAAAGEIDLGNLFAGAIIGLTLSR
jgi:hypothetical protein